MIDFEYYRGIKHLPSGTKIENLSNECLEWIIENHLNNIEEGHAAMIVTECLRRLMKLLTKE